MHKSSLDKVNAFRNKYLEGREDEPLQILDLGSQNIGGSYRDFFKVGRWTYRGMDLDPGENVDIVLEEPYLWKEIESNSVDVLVSGQVFEHIEYFRLTSEEIARVLKPNGLCCIVAPSAGHEHRYPVDCWRFYPDGFDALARYADLEVLEVFTRWGEDSYTDGSNEWQDTVLIAKKPVLPEAIAHPNDERSISPPDYKTYVAPPETAVDESANSCWSKQATLVGQGKSVIDFGCAGGYFAKMLAKNDCQVTGVEMNPDAAKVAEKYCKEVLVLDLDTVSIEEAFQGKQYDVAVFGDVLEHLRDPWRLLRETHKVLRPGGYVVASIPNIAHGAVRLSLLQGSFNYSDVGILDNTHLRFFTRATVESLFEETGYAIDAIDRTKAGIYEETTAFPRIRREDIKPSIRTAVETDLEATTVQFIVRAVPTDWKDQCILARERNVELSQEMFEIRQELSGLHQTFERTTQDLEKTRQDLNSTAQALQDALHMQAAMESSKFWKIRQRWIPFKEWLLRR